MGSLGLGLGLDALVLTVLSKDVFILFFCQWSEVAQTVFSTTGLLMALTGLFNWKTIDYLFLERLLLIYFLLIKPHCDRMTDELLQALVFLAWLYALSVTCHYICHFTPAFSSTPNTWNWLIVVLLFNCLCTVTTMSYMCTYVEFGINNCEVWLFDHQC